MGSLLRGLALILSLVSCATVPIEEYNCYESTIDYLRGRRKPWCNNRSDGEFKLFEGSEPVTATNPIGSVTYVGAIDGPGYCLTPSVGGVEIRAYCTVYGTQLDACVWTDVIDGKSRRVTQLRPESPTCNIQPWKVLDTVFEQARADFLEAAGSDQRSKDAVRKVNGN